MIVVLGSVVVQEEGFDEAVRLSIEHCRRSRAEPGCLTHHVHRDAENSLRLVFVERWADEEALRRHFAVPASTEFVRLISDLATTQPEIEIFEASAASFDS